MKEFIRQLGQRIKCLRQQHNLTQESLAEKADLHASYIGLIERGERVLSLDSLYKISKVLDVSIAELLADDKDMDKLGIKQKELLRMVAEKKPTEVQKIIDIAKIVLK